MHNSFDRGDGEGIKISEWEIVLNELLSKEKEKKKEEEEEEEETIENSSEELISTLDLDPVFLTIGLSTEEGVMIEISGDSDTLLVTLLSALFKGDLDKNILDAVPTLKPIFPNWGDEEPEIYPNSTLWEKSDEDE